MLRAETILASLTFKGSSWQPGARVGQVLGYVWVEVTVPKSEELARLRRVNGKSSEWEGRGTPIGSDARAVQVLPMSYVTLSVMGCYLILIVLSATFNNSALIRKQRCWSLGCWWGSSP